MAEPFWKKHNGACRYSHPSTLLITHLIWRYLLLTTHKLFSHPLEKVRKGGCLQEFKDSLPLKNSFQKCLCRFRIIYRQLNRQIRVAGKRPDSACFRKLDKFSLFNIFTNSAVLWPSKTAKKLIIQKFNLSRKLYDFEEQSSENAGESVIYISSDEEEEATEFYDWDWSTDTEALISRIEREVKSSPILIAGPVMTTEGLDDETEAGSSSSRPVPPVTPKLGFKYLDKKLCYAPCRKIEKAKIDLCNTILPVLESPMSPPEHEKGPSLDTPMPQSAGNNFRASYYIQSVQPYADLSNQRCLSCMVCGKSVDEIKQEKMDLYMESPYTPERTYLHNSPGTGSVFKRS